jgi:hypothetical protein
LDQKEEGINTAMQELKQKYKTMTITEKLKNTQEMKNLQVDLKSIQVDKQSRKSQLEPLQGVEYMLTNIDATKGQIEQDGFKSGKILKEHITTHTVEIIVEKNAQIKSQVEEITNRF